MKKSAIKKIEKEIDEKTKLPYEIKDKIKTAVFTNITIASLIIIYFIFIVLGSMGVIEGIRPMDLKIFSFLFLAIAIVLFEIAYRKGNGNLAIYGIEFLAVAIFSLFLAYIIFDLDENYKKNYLLVNVFIACYYILKSIFISVRIKGEYMNSISDVKEIVKKEKRKNDFSEDIEKVEEEKHIEKNKKTKEQKPKKKETKKENTTPKKRGRPKKAEKNETVIEKQEQKTPKKRGRPKKTEIMPSESKQKESETPKKRGRPKKAVTVKND